MIRAPDKAAPCGYRPNLIARLKGRNHSRTIWIISHLDVVPPGPLNLWETDPYKVVQKGGKLYGRGVEDNQQAIVTSIYAVKAMKELKLVPEYDVALAFLKVDLVARDAGELPCNASRRKDHAGSRRQEKQPHIR